LRFGSDDDGDRGLATAAQAKKTVDIASHAGNASKD
jgi:hypothetical protein